MGNHITLTSSDGFKLGGYRADPEGKPKGGLVVIQEIFGVNSHIRAVCDRFAALGYASVAPALFDRYQPNFESGYSPAEIEHARGYIQKADMGKMLADTQAAIDSLQSVGKVAIVGYCLGGSIAFLAACRLSGLACAIGYYGGMIAKNADEKPKVPTMLHFGETDHSIPLSDVEIIKQKRPDVETYVYPAGHGFSCDERGSYHEPSHKQALERTLGLLKKCVG
ncbi:MAG TPA: dienelactone hydrolase family protein [Xanthobacteraceae bacterium]|nr:dienelactone hydrolase family protein [Xanthobacteraceae bacterium]